MQQELNHLKLSNHKQDIIDEVNAGKFSINMEDHVLHLKSFIDKDTCAEVIRELNNIKQADKSSQYSDGLLNDEADSFFDPHIDVLERIKKKVYDDAMKVYAEKVRAFNWSYHEHKRFRYSEMIVRKYHPNSELSFHHDDIIIEVFPHWFPKRQNILTCNVYFNDATEYEGGDLQFASLDKTISPSVGDVVLFPSNWMFYHKVSRVTSGNRYAGTTWYYYGSDKPIRKGVHHETLFAK